MKFLLFIQESLKRLVQFIESLIRIVFLSSFRVKDFALPSKKDCVILANGPSLNDQLRDHLTFLEGKDSFCVNHFPTADIYRKIKPNNYITSVPELWLDDVDEKYVEQRKKLINSFQHETDWKLNVYLPFESKKSRKWETSLCKNKNINLLHFNNTPVEGFDFFSDWCFDKRLGMPRPHNVLIPTLMIAILSGYENIYLFGVDHSWLPEISVNHRNEVLIHQKHFYDEDTSKSATMDIRGKGERNLAQVLHKFMHAFNGYYEIERYAKRKNVRIINCTKNSFIDAFERMDLNSER